MFTDQPVTPMRLEILVDFMRASTSTKISRKMLIAALQPEAIVGEDSNRTQAKNTIKAATDLELLREEGDVLSLTFPSKDSRLTREIVLTSIDNYVLSDTSVEPYFAPFYSYLLYLNENGTRTRNGDEWARDFERDINRGERTTNPFNDVKLTGLHRWYGYAGLGWYDTTGTFQPNPYYRLRRNLKKIFSDKAVMSGEDFMSRVATVCPELDGGSIYSKTTEHLASAELRCSLGLSHALIDLHSDQIIRLFCPADARGWDLGMADPPRDTTINSSVLDKVEFLVRKKRK